VGSSSRPAAHPAREDPRTVRPHVAPSRTGASESQRAAPRQADPQGGRRSDQLLSANFSTVPTTRIRTPVEVSVAGEADGLGVDVERATGGGFRHRPAVPAVITYLGQRSPGCSCFPRHWRGPRTNPIRCRGQRISPERSGEHIAAVEAADRRGAAPEFAGSKRATHQQGSSGRPAKKFGVRCKM
jgi:hypothetical protein